MMLLCKICTVFFMNEKKHKFQLFRPKLSFYKTNFTIYSFSNIPRLFLTSMEDCTLLGWLLCRLDLQLLCMLQQRKE